MVIMATPYLARRQDDIQTYRQKSRQETCILTIGLASHAMVTQMVKYFATVLLLWYTIIVTLL